MKKFLPRLLAIMIVCASFGAHAQTTPAPQSAAPKVHPCKTEHQTVVAQCKSGDPCGPACKQARQAFKACRAANHLPAHQPKEHKNSPCKMKNSSMQESPSGSMQSAPPGMTNGPTPSNMPSMPAHPSDSSAAPPQ